MARPTKSNRSISPAPGPAAAGTVRPASFGDAFRLAALRDETLREVDRAYRRRAERRVGGLLWRSLLLPLYLAVGCEGWLVGRPPSTAAWMSLSVYRELTHISDLGVRDGARRQGLGQRLVDHACRCARAQGHVLLTLEVDADNHPARALYERNGFVRVTPAAWRGNPAGLPAAAPAPLRRLDLGRGEPALRRATTRWIEGLGLPAAPLLADGPRWLRARRGPVWAIGGDAADGVAQEADGVLRLFLPPGSGAADLSAAWAALRTRLGAGVSTIEWAGGTRRHEIDASFARAGWLPVPVERLFLAAPVGGAP